MTKSNCTFIRLHRRVSELLDPEWSGTPDAETGVFTIGDRYVIRFLELRITIMSESVMGFDKPILSMRYHASLITGEEWATRGEPFAMVPNGQNPTTQTLRGHPLSGLFGHRYASYMDTTMWRGLVVSAIVGSFLYVCNESKTFSSAGRIRILSSGEV